jgi:disulfide oxidoreductase YuzD
MVYKHSTLGGDLARPDHRRKIRQSWRWSKGRKMNIKIILNGGLKTCCKSYSKEYIHDAVKSWLTEKDALEVIDVQEQAYELDELAAYAKQFFQENTFPIVYIDDRLIAIGQIPDKNSLFEVSAKLDDYQITREAIYKAAKEYELVPAEQEADEV